MKGKNFALIGVGGYIAPRHLKAIKEVGGNLVAALDTKDSVGIIDSYFPDAEFFTTFEEFESYLDDFKKKKDEIHYVSICSPNYMHYPHINFSLKLGADAICEKPLVLNPIDLERLDKKEKETGKKVYTILQLRVHPSLLQLKSAIEKNENKKYDVDLIYITSRGKWYFKSWKGEIAKSGGIAVNIGIHFFDMLIWLFGRVERAEVYYREPTRKMTGFLEMERARVKWFLSVDKEDLPELAVKQNKRTYRIIKVDGKEVEFSRGFTDLHTVVYQRILEDKGFGIEDVKPSIELTYNLMRMKISEPNREKIHSLAFSKLFKGGENV